MNAKKSLLRAASSLALSASLLVSVAGIANADLTMPYGSGSSSYSIVNVSGGPGTVVATYYRPTGVIEPGSGGSYNSVQTNQRIDVTIGQAPDGPLPPSWQGSVVLSSEVDIIAMALTRYTGRLVAEDPAQIAAGSLPGTESSAYDAFNVGAKTLYVPSAVRFIRAAVPTEAQLSTRFTVQNTTGTGSNVYINYYRLASGAATYVGQLTRPLSGYGSVTLDTAKDADVPAPVTNNVVMALVITSTVDIAGVVEQSWNFDGVIGTTPAKQNWSADYSMLLPAQASNVLYSPSNVRIGTVSGTNRPCQFANYATMQFFTQAAIQNTSDQVATVSAEFFRSNNTGANQNRPSGQTYYTTTFTIQPKASWVINMFNGSSANGILQNNAIWGAFGDSYNAATGQATHCNWQGSIKFTSNRPLVGFGLIQQPQADQNYASGYGFFGGNDATSTVFIPRFDRVCVAGTCGFATDVKDFSEFSALTVVNVGPASTTLTAVQFFPTAGGAAPLSTVTTKKDGSAITLAPGASYTFNSRNGADGSEAQTQALGTNYHGAVKIIAPAGAKIRAIVNSLEGKVQADAYNAFNR